MTGHNERTIVDQFVERVGGYHRECLVNYYVALKAARFVILAGPQSLNKMCLARGLAEVLVGEPSKQWSLLQAHPWWVTRSGDPGLFAIAHARFCSAKLLDVIEEASAGEAARLPLPFFVGMEHMSPAEAVCYFHDLPKNRFWQPDGAVVQIRVPENLYITGSLDVEEKDGLASAPQVYRRATVIRLRREDVRPSVETRRQWQARPDWQARFVRSAIHSGDEARARVAQIFSDDSAPLAPLDELERRLRAERFCRHVCEKAWLYVANSFDAEGRGLFVEPVLENLCIAQDYAILQGILPSVINGWTESSTAWHAEISEYLAPQFQRAHAWIEELAKHDMNMLAKARAGWDSIPSAAELGAAAAQRTGHR